MGFSMGSLDPTGMFGGDASDASKDAANIQAKYQREALAYLKEADVIPREYRESALGELANQYGIGDDPEGMQKAIDAARQSPMFTALMGGREAGEESILRHAGATGGLRSGGVQENLYDYNVQLENKALLASYGERTAGLEGMAGLPSLAPAIAAGTTGIGTTLAAGQVGAAQAQQTGMGMMTQTGIGIAGLFV